MMQQFEAARTGEVGTPHPMNVVVMMYDGSIDYLRRAIECAGGNDETGMRTFTDKTRDIISGLNSALDLDAGGEMAKNLETYYAVMDRILVKAKEDMDAASLRKVMDMLSGVKESWEHVRDSYQAGQESATSH
jgi:flagellar secretion chaperone FliS